MWVGLTSPMSPICIMVKRRGGEEGEGRGGEEGKGELGGRKQKKGNKKDNAKNVCPLCCWSKKKKAKLSKGKEKGKEKGKKGKRGGEGKRRDGERRENAPKS